MKEKLKLSVNKEIIFEERAKEIILNISNILKKLPIEEKHETGLYSSNCGAVLYLLSESIYTNKDNSVYINEIIHRIMDSINNGHKIHSFSGGIAGFAWLLEYLVRIEYFDRIEIEVLDELDIFLYKKMIEEIKKDNLDFLHGAIGIGYYFLKRIDKPKIKMYLNELIIGINHHAIKNNNEIKWQSILDFNDNSTGYNLGLAHGIPSYLVFLSKVYKLGISINIVEDLLSGATNFLINNQNKKVNKISYFPVWINEKNNTPSESSRLAWCYGDLGISMALYQVSKVTDNKILEKLAIEVLLNASNRRNLVSEQVIDAGLCHGTAGIAHIFNRMYRNTGIEKFKETSDFWIEETLKMAKFDDGLAGYKAWHTEKYGGWVNEYGLLEGIAGIGLALISAVSDIEPKWDECLLLS